MGGTRIYTETGEQIETFDEAVFLYAMTSRPEDVRIFSSLFQSEWLKDKRMIPILEKAYEFSKEKGEACSIPAMRQVFKKEDKDLYENRYKPVLDTIEQSDPDKSTLRVVLDQVRDVCITRSFTSLVNDEKFILAQAGLDGSKQLKIINKWIQHFADRVDEESADIRQAVDLLVKNHGFENKWKERVLTGVDPIDEWTSGGLQNSQVAIMMAPTGHGKSAFLANITYNMGWKENYPVWFITNELTLHEQTERLLSRITGETVQSIEDDPVVAFNKIRNQWHGADKRIKLTSINREVSCSDLEHMMARWVNVEGWKPRIIVLDFMERMKPDSSGYGRDKEWQWLGAIAKDLTRLAKRHKILIWTAAQTNRAGLNTNELDMAMAQSSIRHFQEAAFVVGMNQVAMFDSEGDEQIVLQLKPLKQRKSRRATRPRLLKVDLSRMLITNQEQELVLEEEEEEENTKSNKTPWRKK